MNYADNTMTNVLIYGSCVSRDTFEYLDQGSYRLERYIARQSLISAFSAPTSINSKDLSRLQSDFQRRMVRDDFLGSLKSDLIEFGDRSDIMLWDLTDERYGVWDLGGGRYVTRSVELIASGIDARLETQAKLVPFGSRRHLKLWTTALRAFAEAMRDSAFSRPPILIAPRWAHQDENGHPISSPIGLDLSRANQLLEKYTRKAGRIQKVTTQSDSIRAGLDHRWGVAPYHYTEAVYDELARDVAKAVHDRKHGL